MVLPKRGSSLAITLFATGSGTVKMPNDPSSRVAKNATVPDSLSDGTVGKKIKNGPELWTMVVVGPPEPVKMPSPPASRMAKNATVPDPLSDGPKLAPKPANGPVVS